MTQILLDLVSNQRNRHHPVRDIFDEWQQRAASAESTAMHATAGDELEEASESAATFELRVKRFAEATLLARLGALLHDFGHVPYGHSIEDDLRLLFPHDANPRRFDALWDGLLTSVRTRVGERLAREGVSKRTIETRLRALRPLTRTGPLHQSLRPLVLSKADWDPDQLGKRRDVDPASALADHPFVADLVGNTICADLIDYLHRDHLFTGLPIALGDRFMSSFYVTPTERGGLYAGRMVLLLHREGRPRRDVVTEILKHLRYRYELQERVLAEPPTQVVNR